MTSPLNPFSNRSYSTDHLPKRLSLMPRFCDTLGISHFRFTIFTLVTQPDTGSSAIIA